MPHAAEIQAIADHGDLAALAATVARASPEVAHNDPKLANFLFRDDVAVCLLDLDTLMPTATCWDVADLVRSAGTRAAEDDPDPIRHQVEPELVEAIFSGYGATGAIQERIEQACVLIAWEQSARFLTDWLQGDRYWKTTSATQNLDRARGQLALLGVAAGRLRSLNDDGRAGSAPGRIFLEFAA